MPGRRSLWASGVVWRCAVIALIPALTWALGGPEPLTKWQRAGDLHYQVRYIPGTDEACIVLKFKDITPGLEPFTCWD